MNPMTPREARFGLIAFALLLAGLSVNLFALQGAVPVSQSKARGERGQLATADKASRPPPAVPDETAGLAAKPVIAEASAAAPPNTDGSSTVRAIQRELQIRGYETGGVDGALSIATRAAIMAYEHDHAMPLTGEANADALKRILLGASAKSVIGSAAGRAERRANAEAVIRTVQQSLSGLGYNPGATNGKIGEETRRAIRDFEIDSRMPETGRVSGALIVRLAIEAGNRRRPSKR